MQLDAGVPHLNYFRISFLVSICYLVYCRQRTRIDGDISVAARKNIPNSVDHLASLLLVRGPDYKLLFLSSQARNTTNLRAATCICCLR